MYHNVFCMYLTEMRKLGYVNYYKVLNAVDYGIPQSRPRLFIVSKRSVGFKWPDTVPLTSSFVDYLDDSRPTEYEIRTHYKNAPIIEQKQRAHLIREGTCFDLRLDHKYVTLYNPRIHGCLVRSHGFTGAIIKRHGIYRKIRGMECLRLQGWANDRLSDADEFSNKQLVDFAGNSICIPVIQKIIQNLI